MKQRTLVALVGAAAGLLAANAARAQACGDPMVLNSNSAVCDGTPSGSTCTAFECDAGYTPSEPDPSCSAGAWISTPVCVAAFCPSLDDPHGTWIWSAPITGGVAMLTCDSGYELSGSDTVQCTGVAESESDWNPKPGFCEGEATAVPALGPGGSITLAMLLLALGTERLGIGKRSRVSVRSDKYGFSRFPIG